MAAPITQDTTTLTTEGLKKAGYASPTSAQLTRAEIYLEEIKSDITTVERRLTSLQTTAVLVTTNGQNRYALPTDFLSDLTMTRVDGATTGTAQAGSTSSITFEATDSSETGDNIGIDILVYENTGKGSMSQVTSYNTTTKVAGVIPNFTTAPDNTSKYMKIDQYRSMTETPVWEFEKNRTISSQDAPTHFMPVGDADDGEVIIWPTPYRTGEIPWGLQLRYYADLQELDLTSTTLATLYKKWRNIWVLGVYYKQLQSDDDDRQTTARDEYFREIQEMVSREKYGYDLTNMNMAVRNY